MGSSLEPFKNGINLFMHPDVTPDPTKEPTFDACSGFITCRKMRCLPCSEDELKSAKIPLEDRDYCAHLLMKFRVCRKDNWPFAVCKAEKHEYLKCQHEDFILRMKEYERERRLMLKYRK
ncbi:unnamed protein product [Psylliodes chrysocephalus]|uniref:NADH dehydrogenase [ubiquinone] 1 beta subcomplex subunit 7 n=1 Tax=Psylliodes chrysocephalus TaxID=3402493 RepID=A0A9P0DBA8_9CUCU|nr:unnamed protein product [Psylliodes chrysocephala]